MRYQCLAQSSTLKSLEIIVLLKDTSAWYLFAAKNA